MKSLNYIENNNDYTANNIEVSRLFLVLLAALALTIVPLPSVIAKCRPNFVLLIVLYMQCCIPMYFRIAWVFMLGILLDVLTATSIGEHSLAFIITTWVATEKPTNFKYYSILQQMIVILIYCMLYQLLITLVDSFFAIKVNIYESICVVLLSVAIWPMLGLIFAPKYLPNRARK